ncbi:MAG TPA: ATP-binding protein [Candidatus Cybelea sp.]|nr:ATP-binding protein [Candidatus Cybelea sp.]
MSRRPSLATLSIATKATLAVGAVSTMAMLVSDAIWLRSILLIGVLLPLPMLWYLRTWLIEARRRARSTAKRLSATIDARHEADRRFEDLMDMVTDFVFETDAALRLTFVSERVLDLYGIKPQDIVGLNLTDVFERLNAHPEAPEYRIDISDRKPVRDAMFSITDTLGHRRHMRMNARPLFDAEQRFQGYRGACRDETELAEAAVNRHLTQSRTAAALDAMQEGFCLFDIDDRLVVCNRRFREINSGIADVLKPGIEYAEGLRIGIARGVYDLRGLKPEEFVARRLEQRRNPSSSVELKLADGRWLMVNDRRTADGGFVSVTMDISAVKEAQDAARRNEARFMSFVDNIRGLAFYRREIGEKSASIFGADAAFLVGTVAESGRANLRAWISAIHPDDQHRYMEASRRQELTGEDLQIEFRFVHPVTGETRWMMERSWWGKDPEGNRRFMDGYVLDITDRKAGEHRLTAAVEAAEFANRSKTEFLANMSHELRTPLNAIIGFSDIMANELFGPLGVHQYGEYARDINESGQHLLAVIQDILDVAKAEAGKLDLEESEFDVSEIIASATRMVRERGERARLTLDEALPPDLPRFFGDARKLKQIALNLLTNAVKFTPEGGRVEIAAVHRGDGGLDIIVTDTGIGIAPRDIPRALEPFVQLEAGFGRKYEGSGLGLPLCKALTELHGGRLEIVSDVGRGTAVTVAMPAERTRDQGGPEKAPAPLGDDVVPAKAIRLLCIDDDPMAAKLLEALITTLDWRTEFVWAENGAKGLALVRDWQPDLILLDLRMPGWDGLTTIDKLADDARGRHVPIVVLSAMSLDHQTAAGLQSRGIGVLNKSDLSAGALKAAVAATIPVLAKAS